MISIEAGSIMSVVRMVCWLFDNVCIRAIFMRYNVIIWLVTSIASS